MSSTDRSKHNTKPIYDFKLANEPIERDRELIKRSRSTSESSHDSVTSPDKVNPKQQSTSATPKHKGKAEEAIELQNTVTLRVIVSADLHILLVGGSRTIRLPSTALEEIHTSRARLHFRFPECTHLHVGRFHYMCACEDSYKKDFASSRTKMLAQVTNKCILSVDAGWPNIHFHPCELFDLNAYPVNMNVLEELHRFASAFHGPMIKLLVVDKEGEPKGLISLARGHGQGYWYTTADIGGRTVRMGQRIQNVLLCIDIPLPREN
jgi:hypothetical protein